MTTTTRNKWQRVTRRRPCPICDRPDWCLFAGDPQDPQAVICARTESPKRCGDAGWLHRLRDDPAWRPTARRRLTIPLATPNAARGDWSRLAAQYAAALQPHALDTLGHELGSTPTSLRRLGIGRSDRWRCWTFPLRDAAGAVVGINRRFADGGKRIIAGGRVGLYVPEGIDTARRLLITEGATDCAAMLDLGFAAIGRYSCNTGISPIVGLTRRLRPEALVIVADRDPAGRRGAEGLASALLAYVPVLRVITPPYGLKDARAWRQAGATRRDIMRVIEAAAPRQISVTCKAKGVMHGR